MPAGGGVAASGGRRRRRIRARTGRVRGRRRRWRRQRRGEVREATRERSCRGLSAAAMSSRRGARPEASARWCATKGSPAGERRCAHARKRARFASACVAASGRSARKVSPFFTGASATSARPRPSIDTHATRGGEGPSLRASIARVRAIESSSAAAVRADAPPTAAGADPASSLASRASCPRRT